jgi:hypothetical protein
MFGIGLGDPIYNEIDVDWCSPIIYDVYFNGDYDSIINNKSNGIDDVINNVLIDNLKVEWKENNKGAQQNK